MARPVLLAFGVAVGPVPWKPPDDASWCVTSQSAARFVASDTSVEAGSASRAEIANEVASVSASASDAQPRVEGAGTVAS